MNGAQLAMAIATNSATARVRKGAIRRAHGCTFPVAIRFVALSFGDRVSFFGDWLHPAPSLTLAVPLGRGPLDGVDSHDHVGVREGFDGGPGGPPHKEYGYLEDGEGFAFVFGDDFDEGHATVVTQFSGGADDSRYCRRDGRPLGVRCGDTGLVVRGSLWCVGRE